MNYCKEVGERIRFFRKKRGYTLVELAGLLYKSKSVVSKYERGEVAIDILTIRQIAEILNVPISSLLNDDLSQTEPIFDEEGAPAEFGKNDSVSSEYIYTCFAHENKPVLRVMHLKCNQDKAVLYVYPTDVMDGKSFEHYYTGRVIRESTFMRVLAANPLVKNDVIIADFPARFHVNKPSLGFFLSISIPPYSPVASQAILSDKQIRDEEWLRDKLSLGKDHLKACRKLNCFTVSLTSHYQLSKESSAE